MKLAVLWQHLPEDAKRAALLALVRMIDQHGAAVAAQASPVGTEVTHD